MIAVSVRLTALSAARGTETAIMKPGTRPNGNQRFPKGRMITESSQVSLHCATSRRSTLDGGPQRRPSRQRGRHSLRHKVRGRHSLRYKDRMTPTHCLLVASRRCSLAMITESVGSPCTFQRAPYGARTLLAIMNALAHQRPRARRVATGTPLSLITFAQSGEYLTTFGDRGCRRALSAPRTALARLGPGQPAPRRPPGCQPPVWPSPGTGASRRFARRCPAGARSRGWTGPRPRARPPAARAA